MIVSTKYDDELKAKVFVVRGDERYTRSTITTLAVTTANTNRSYLAVILTATVRRHLGQSSVVFYDGDMVIGVATCNSNQTNITIQARVNYGSHKFYAKYMGNAQCLSSKSGIKEVTVDEPALTKTRIDVDNIEEYYLESSGFTITGNLLKIVSDVPSALVSKTITMVVGDGEIYSESTTSTSGGEFSFSGAAYQLGEGIYDARISFDGDDTYLGYDFDFVLVISHDNCIIETTTKYAKIGVGDTAIFDVTAKSFKEEPLENITVTLERD